MYHSQQFWARYKNYDQNYFKHISFLFPSEFEHAKDLHKKTVKSIIDYQKLWRECYTLRMIEDSWSAYLKVVDLSQFSPNVKISRYFKHQMPSLYYGFTSTMVRRPVQVFAAEKEIPIVKMERIFCFQSLPLITCSK